MRKYMFSPKLISMLILISSALSCAEEKHVSVASPYAEDMDLIIRDIKNYYAGIDSGCVPYREKQFDDDMVSIFKSYSIESYRVYDVGRSSIAFGVSFRNSHRKILVQVFLENKRCKEFYFSDVVDDIHEAPVNR